MRIGIDYTPALRERAGIGRFTRELVRALSKLDKEHEYVLVRTRDSGTLQGQDWPGNFRICTLPLGQRAAAWMWHRLHLPLPLDLFTGPLDLFHATDYTLPPLRRGRAIVTVHDLSFLRYPECAPPALVQYLTRAVPKAAQRADLVLVDSFFTKGEIVDLLGLPEENIEVVYGGVGPQFVPGEEGEATRRVLQQYHLDHPFLLTLGTLEPRKNMAGLLEAYALLRREADLEHHLLIGGGKGWLYQDIFRQVEQLGLEDTVRFLDYVPEEDLPALLSSAALFVYPSLYEGFGLPPLEAMACGTPVVASNASSLPEVLGDAALMVEPTSAPALASAIYRVLVDDELRGSLVDKGKVRASRFTWAAAAQKLLDLYQRFGE